VSATTYTTQIVGILERECRRAEAEGEPGHETLARIAEECYCLGARDVAFDVEMKERKAGRMMHIELNIDGGSEDA
jgi:hypothetical protein